jgi:long-subunit fatty acid transport protein
MMIFCLTVTGKAIRPCNVYAQYPDLPDMIMNATPNPVGSGARAMGIGGAFISVADDATAASWNPAGLIHLKKPEISVVGSFFSGRVKYRTYQVDGDIEDRSPTINHLSYFSAAKPFVLLSRIFVFSVNYQHLYEFSQDSFTIWRELDSQAMIDLDLTHRDYRYQKGSLYTISPALAVQIVPSFLVGLTCNFWDNDILENGWENLTVQDSEGIEFGSEKVSHSEIYEKYEFSGFNMHIGFLFKSKYYTIRGGRRRFRIGGILKTPFKADIRHERRVIYYERFPENPILNNHDESISLKDLNLKMPVSYGLGFSLDLSDNFFIALDVYRTHWEQYVLVYPTGVERSPVNKDLKKDANIKPTTQIRLGTEYLVHHNRRIIPLRFGIFYDPEPASGDVDDFYGASVGTGILLNDFAFDIAYQYRFGRRPNAASMQGEEISSKIKQHYLYSSMIFYF